MTDDEQITTVLYDKVRHSRCVIMAATSRIDAKLVVELGMAVLLNKPLIVLVPEGVILSPKLRLVASEIISIPADHQEWDGPVVDAVNAALDRVTATFSDTEQ